MGCRVTKIFTILSKVLKQLDNLKIGSSYSQLQLCTSPTNEEKEKKKAYAALVFPWAIIHGLWFIEIERLEMIVAYRLKEDGEIEE